MTDEELYEVLDEQGNKTGQVLAKSKVHEQELRHASVFIWIYNLKGEVLLQLRSKDKNSFPGVWDVSVAGHISAGDTPIETAVREIEEEIGIKIKPKELIEIGFLSDVVPWRPGKKHPEFCWLYILHNELDPKKLHIQQEELTSLKLQAINELQTARQKPGSEKIYATRNSQIYDMAFLEIKKRLSQSKL